MAKKLLSILVIATMVLSLFSVTAFASETQKAEKVVFVQTFDGVDNSTDGNLGCGVYGELNGDWTEYNSKQTTATAKRKGNRRWTVGGAASSSVSGVKTSDDNSYFVAAGNHQSYYAKYKVNLDNTVFENGATYKLAMDVTYTLDNTYDKEKNSIDIYLCGLKNTTTDDSALNNGLGRKTTTVYKDTPVTIFTNEFVYAPPAATVTGMDLDNAEISCAFRVKLTDASSLGTFDDKNGNGVRDKYTDATTGKELDEPLKYGKASSERLTIDNVRVIKIVDACVADAEADAGYYAEAFDSENKNGTIAFSSEITEGIDDAAKYGIWVYRADDNTKEDTVTVTDIDSLKEAEGKFSVVVEDIPQEHFATGVCAKPFMIIGDTTVWGNVTTFSVNEALKWLGNN
ncbi:MAG: hypothetical protein E7391_06135 [Ruminococcaceae bacterium]|nr:hypothetical protein [Oscillospiraceae bacterium]